MVFGTNVSLDDLARYPILVAHIRPDHLNKFPLSDTPALLAAISSAPQGPSVQTVRT